MIFFGDPESKGEKEDALACVNMALAMRKCLSDLNTAWRNSGIEAPLVTRIGIHTGYCTVGNFGSEDRMDYTIIGGAVNRASRLENEAPAGEIIISFETFSLIKDEIHCEEFGEFQVRGIAYPLTTYRVIDTVEALGRQRRRYHAEHTAVKVDLDLDAMTAEDRVRALETLEEAQAILSQEGDTLAKSPRKC